MIRVCLVALLLMAGATGCALASKGKPVEVHWYTPEVVRPGSANPQAAGPALRLGFVRSGPELGERVALSDGAWRVGFYDDRRWTERPARYVKSALRRALFESHRFTPATQTTAPQVDVELVSFQEIRSERAHAGRVALHLQLVTDRVLLDETIVRDEPVRGDQFDDVVAAISRALDGAADEAARRIQGALYAVP